jgi:hypothetical protein
VHGGRGEALTRTGRMEGEMDPIMMEKYQIKQIMETTGKMHNGSPYQFNMNNKKRAMVEREGLESDE